MLSTFIFNPILVLINFCPYNNISKYTNISESKLEVWISIGKIFENLYLEQFETCYIGRLGESKQGTKKN
jgi:hypothetical protein